MTVTLEDGTGVAGANSYASVATVSAFWADMPQRPEAGAWAGASDAAMAGAAIEASRYIDAIYGGSYRGTRAGHMQGLEWPRTGANDDAGNALPDLPAQIVEAVCELAGRAVTAPLAADQATQGEVKREKKGVGPLSKETEWVTTGSTERKFGAVAGMLAPVLRGVYPGANNSGWEWL